MNMVWIPTNTRYRQLGFKLFADEWKWGSYNKFSQIFNCFFTMEVSNFELPQTFWMHPLCFSYFFVDGVKFVGSDELAFSTWNVISTTHCGVFYYFLVNQKYFKPMWKSWHNAFWLCFQESFLPEEWIEIFSFWIYNCVGCALCFQNAIDTQSMPTKRWELFLHSFSGLPAAVVENSTSQSAWLHALVEGHVHIYKFYDPYSWHETWGVSLWYSWWNCSGIGK